MPRPSAKQILLAADGAREIGDRRQAIETAIGELVPGDVLLIAGKGHEDYQIIGTTKHHFSDHEVVLETLQRTLAPHATALDRRRGRQSHRRPPRGRVGWADLLDLHRFREIAAEALFVAIKGDVHDGHDFVGKALEAGATAALVSRVPIFMAKGGPGADRRPRSARRRWQALARGAAAQSRADHRGDRQRRQDHHQGSDPHHARAPSARRTTRSRVFNNHWGVPLMLARLPREAQFGVFEIGMNHAGEITPLVKLVRPHIAVITTVAAAPSRVLHARSTTSRAAKAEIFLGLEPGGVALLNADHDYLHILFAACAGGRRRARS